MNHYRRETPPPNRDADLEVLNRPHLGSEPASRKPLWTKNAAVILFVVMVVYGAGVGTAELIFGKRLVSAEAPQPPARSPNTTGGPLSASQGVDVSGRIVVRRTATVSSPYTARLRTLLVREGDRVIVGQVLAELDAEEADAAKEAAQNRAEQMAASEEQARASYRLSRLSFERGEKLTESGFITRAHLDELKIGTETAAATLAAARFARRAAEADLRSAEIVTRRLVVRAPFSGVVSAVSAEKGEIVSPASAGGGFVRTGICTVLDLSSREIEAFVPERYLAQLGPGTLATFRTEAIPNRSFRAKIVSTGSEIDMQRSAVKLRLALLDPIPQLLPNMTVTVRLLTDRLPDHPNAR